MGLQEVDIHRPFTETKLIMYKGCIGDALETQVRVEAISDELIILVGGDGLNIYKTGVQSY